MIQKHSSYSTAVSASEVLPLLQLTTERHGCTDTSTRLEEIRLWLASDLSEIETVISKIDALEGASGTRSEHVSAAAAQLLSLPGKRVRALCVLLGARLGTKNAPERHDLAIAAELVHAATLLHDDVIDDADERRGATASRVIYGNAASILGGDHLLVTALRFIANTGHFDLLCDMLDTLRDMVAGEALQLERRGTFSPNQDLYLEIIRGKTARLFSWALCAGARVASAEKSIETELCTMGTSLGMAFQLVDDLLDLDGNAAVLGKDPLVDLKEGKLTWPWILAAERDPSLLAELRHVITQDASLAEMNELVVRAKKLEVIEDTKALALRYAEEATLAIDRLPPSDALEPLRFVVEASVQRVR